MLSLRGLIQHFISLIYTRPWDADSESLELHRSENRWIDCVFVMEILDLIFMCLIITTISLLSQRGAFLLFKRNISPKLRG